MKYPAFMLCNIVCNGNFDGRCADRFGNTIYVNDHIDAPIDLTAQSPGCNYREAIYVLNHATDTNIAAIQTTLDCTAQNTLNNPLGGEDDQISITPTQFAGPNPQPFIYHLDPSVGELLIEVPMSVQGVFSNYPDNIYVEIDAQHQTRIFRIDYKNPTISANPKVVFKGLRLVNAHVPDDENGGAILIEATLTNASGEPEHDHMSVELEGVSIANSSAGAGGGIFVDMVEHQLSDVELKIKNSQFLQNSAKSFSAGITAFVNEQIHLNIQNSSFISNSTDYTGGAIFISGPTLGSLTSKITIQKSAFIDNSAKNAGGAIAIYLGPIDLQVVNSTFAKNRATSAYPDDHFGGAMALYNQGSSLTFVHNTFMENSAKNNGSALYMHEDTGNTVEFLNNVVFDNTSEQSSAKQLLISNLNITGNAGMVVSENNVFSTIKSEYDDLFLPATGPHSHQLVTDPDVYPLGVVDAKWINNPSTWRLQHPYPQWAYKPKTISSPLLDHAMGTNVNIDQNHDARPSTTVGDPGLADVGSIEAQNFDPPVLLFSSATTAIAKPSPQNNMQMMVYPNPAVQGELIQCRFAKQQHIQEVLLYDMQGNQVQRYAINKGVSSLDLRLPTGIQSGAYTLTFKSDRQSVTRKLIIENT
ncbi:MAG: T9SS type A sorting domain-containing protein [Bdellovibrionota bacterium]